MSYPPPRKSARTIESTLYADSLFRRASSGSRTLWTAGRVPSSAGRLCEQSDSAERLTLILMHSQPPPQGYGQQPGYPPPQGQYPPQQQPYGQPGSYPPPQGPPPPQQQYGQPSYPPPGQFGAPQPIYGTHPGQQPPQQPYGAPPGQYAHPSGFAPPPQHAGPPTPASPGYIDDARYLPPTDMNGPAADLRDAMKGFGTNEKKLIATLTAVPDAPHMDKLRRTYDDRFRRSLIKDIQSETSSKFEDVCWLIFVRNVLIVVRLCVQWQEVRCSRMHMQLTKPLHAWAQTRSFLMIS